MENVTMDEFKMKVTMVLYEATKDMTEEEECEFLKTLGGMIDGIAEALCKHQVSEEDRLLMMDAYTKSYEKLEGKTDNKELFDKVLIEEFEHLKKCA